MSSGALPNIAASAEQRDDPVRRPASRRGSGESEKDVLEMMIAWQYGLLSPLSGPHCPAEYAWAEDCENEMRLQVDFWNRLVAIENKRGEAEREVLISDDPALKKLWSEFQTVLTRLDEYPRRPPREADAAVWRAEVSAVRQQRHDLWIELKPLIAAARTRHREQIKELADARYQTVKDARNNSSLWWGNYNAVCMSFEVARARLAGGARLREQQWYGAGRLTNQLMGGFPAVSLGGKGHAQVRIEDMPIGHPLLRRGSGAKGKLKLLVATVYASGRGSRRLAAWPIVMHRDFPPGAMVKTVTVHRRRIFSETGALPGEQRDVSFRNSDWRWTVSFSCEVPDVPASTSNAACGVDLGWRIVPGGVRVATVLGTDGNLNHIMLPQSWLDRRVRLSELLGEARVTADNAEDDDDRREATRLRRAANHGIDEANTERREMYRIVAKSLTECYGTIAIDGSGIAQLARRRKAGEPGTDLPPMVRRMRTWSAPAELMSEIERAAKARGCRVDIATGPSTITCHQCGERTEPAARADLIWRCRHCGAIWDQDENAAKNLLAVVLAGSGSSGVAAAARKTQGLRRTRGDRKASKPPEARI